MQKPISTISGQSTTGTHFLTNAPKPAFVFGLSAAGFSGAAAAAAYVLCQYCIFKFLALLLSLGENAKLGLLLMGILLFMDYQQMLGLGNRPAIKLTIKTGIVYLLVAGLFIALAGGGLLYYAYTQI